MSDLTMRDAQGAPRANILDNNAYQQFDPTLSYRSDPKAKWKNGGGGIFQAGPFTNSFVRRGNPNGQPAIFLIGGPGSALNSGYKQYFNPLSFNVAMADWRGVGTSSGADSLTANTTADLVSDVATLQQCAFGMEKPILFGSSWGATVAMAYAKTYPDNIAGLVLRLPGEIRESDTAWEYGPDGVAQRNPQAYADFCGGADHASYKTVVKNYAARLRDPDPVVQQDALLKWAAWEWTIMGDDFTAEDRARMVMPDLLPYNLKRAQIFSDYAANNYYLPADGVPGLPGTLPDVPTIVICNERDTTQAPDALAVMRANMPRAEFVVQPDADWHYIYKNTPGDRRDNRFIEEACAYAAEKIRRIVTNETPGLKLAL